MIFLFFFFFFFSETRLTEIIEHLYKLEDKTVSKKNEITSTTVKTSLILIKQHECYF